MLRATSFLVVLFYLYRSANNYFGVVPKPVVVFLSVVLIVLLSNMTPARANTITATHISNSLIDMSAASGGAQFDSASVSVFVDPAITQWIAWNDATQVVKTHPSRPGEVFLGPGGIGVDDFIRLTVTRVSPASSLTLDIDQNTGVAVSFGTQNVIFGTAAAAPDVMRAPGGFPGPVQFLDEAGSHNSIFTSAGFYNFQFSFRNQFASSAAHPEMWLLQNTVPELLIDVSIDIKPGSDPNSINLGSNGNIPVAIFSTDAFDATTVDPATIMLADAEVRARGKKGDLMSSFEDVNEDGLLDLLIHIDTQSLVLSDGDVEALLTGETFDGLSISGTDAIRIVGSSGGQSIDAFTSEDAPLLAASAVPEPSTAVLLCMGAVGLTVFGSRGRRRVL